VAVQDPYKALRDEILPLFRLNPDFTDTEVAAIYRLAEQVGGKHFDEFAGMTERIIRLYLESPPKAAEQQILAEYFHHIDRSARLLAAKGEVNLESQAALQEGQSVALVGQHVMTSLDWCKVVARADVPKGLVLARDACQRRNDLLFSVMEYMLVILQLIDFDKALAWELDYLEKHRGQLDPDFVRDLLNAWLRAESLPPPALHWAEIWSADENLTQQWPMVVKKADRLLRNYALRRWRQGRTEKTSGSLHLRRIIERHLKDDGRLLRWLEAGITEIGESVHFFVSSMNREEAPPEAREWRGAAMLREIKRIDGLFMPILLLADLILAVPDGAYRFALAFFGLLGTGRKQWEEKLLAHAERVVRRTFVRYLGQDKTPVDIINTLSFGDEDMRLKLMGELDWITKQFDSVDQREKVVRQLAIYYASYREPQLLAAELARRYRDLMRVLHEDNLRRVLTSEQFDEAGDLSVLRDLTSVAAAARRFLTHRRALETTVEEMVAAELDFGRTIRRRRLVFIHQLLV